VIVKPRELRNYVAPNGKEPFTVWMSTVRGQEIYRRVIKRLDRVEDGNLGDFSPVGDGVWELRFFDNSAHRVYYGEDAEIREKKTIDLIILLLGGNKATQVADIATAKDYWDDYNA
jgi:putative addiction module killer protein